MLIHATRDVLQRIFDPIIQHVLDLVDGQVTKARNKRSGQGPKVYV